MRNGRTNHVTDALRRSGANLKKAQELTGVGSWEWDVATSRLYWSDQVFAILGRDRALGPPGFDEYLALIHPDDRENMRAMAVAAIERGEPNVVEYRVTTPRGERTLRSIAGPELDDHGRVVRLHGAITDETDARSAQAELRRSEANLRRAQDLARIGSWAWDVRSDTVEWSDGMYTITGRDPALGAPAPDEFYASIHPDDLDRMRRVVSEARATARPYDVEYRMRTPGGIVHVRSIAEPLVEGSLVVGLRGTLIDTTASKRREAELHRSRMLLEKAQELARIGSASWDAETGAIEWSPGMYVITDRDPALGPPTDLAYLDLVHPDDVERFRTTTADALRAGRSFELEYRLRTPRGTVYVRSIAEPLVAEERVVGLLGTLIDVTENKRREQELRRSRQNLEKAQELAHVGSWEFFWPDRVVWSDEVFRIADRDPALGAPSLDEYIAGRVHPDDREELRRRLAEATESGQPYEVRYRILGPRGVRHLRSLGETLKDEHGRPLSMQGTVIDVTDTVLAEARLRESRERLDLALAGGRMGLWDWDIEASRVLWDARWAAMLGFTPEELPETYAFWRDHVHPDDIAEVEAGLAAALHEEAAYDVEYRMLTKDGDWIWTHSRGRVSERGGDGRPLRMTGVQFDVHERHEAAAAAQKAEERARRAEHLASIGTLAAGVAHELNNPLGGIVLAATWAADVLDRSGPDGVSSAREALRDVLRDATRGRQIVAGVLQFARADLAERRPVGARALIEGAVGAVAPYAETRGAQLTVDVPDALPVVLASEGQLLQVLVNLLHNALESREQGVILAVSAEVAEGHLCIHVDDNGHGLSDHVRRHLFEPFFTTRRDQGGTGLGLSLSHGIVAQHAGTIDVTSSPLGGTRFTVRLPIASA